MFPAAPRPPRLRVKIHNSNTRKKRKPARTPAFFFTCYPAELATGLLGGLPLCTLLCTLLRGLLSALTGTLFCSHLKLSIMEVLALPIPRWTGETTTFTPEALRPPLRIPPRRHTKLA